MIARMDQNLVGGSGSTISRDLSAPSTDIQPAARRRGDRAQVAGTQNGYEPIVPHARSPRRSRATTCSVMPTADGTRSTPASGVRPLAKAKSPTASIPIRACSATPWPAPAMPPAPRGRPGRQRAHGLSVKQSLALQSLLAAQHRSGNPHAPEARDLATEDEARQRFKSFVGTGSAYTRDVDEGVMIRDDRTCLSPLRERAMLRMFRHDPAQPAGAPAGPPAF